MQSRLIHLLAIACLLLLLGCAGSDSVENVPAPEFPPPQYSFANFDLLAGDPAAIPLPNDVLRDLSTGNLSLPSFGDPAIDALIAQVNTLKGFSTSSFVRIPIKGKIDPDTVNNQNIFLVNLGYLSALQGDPTLPLNPFVALDLSVNLDESGENHVIKGWPVTPLAPGLPHLVIVTNRVIGDPSNLPLESDLYTLLLKGSVPLEGSLAGLEPLRSLYESTIWPAAEAVTGLTPAPLTKVDIPLAFLFTTQPLFQTLPALRARAQTESPSADVISAAVGSEAVDGLFNLLGFGFVPHSNIGAIYSASFNAPNFISHPLFGSFQGEGDAVQEINRVDIKFLAALPPGPGPFPTFIFQHGITSSKEVMLILADFANSAGIALLAMDMVLHGERSIDGDGDGVVDSSGAYFINLQSPLTQRDNNRQAITDLHMFTRMVTSGGTDFNGDGAPDLFPAATFIGMSLGGIVGTGFVATEPNITTAVLNAPGGRLTRLLSNSDSFGPLIDAGLAQFGLFPGSALYDIYFMFSQAIVDDADPFNYAAVMFNGALTGGIPTNILIQEMIGDSVVPNSSTQDLAVAMGIAQANALVAYPGLEQVTISPAGYAGSALYQYADAGHSALLNPADGPTEAIANQAGVFLFSGFGGTPVVLDPFGGAKQVTTPFKEAVMEYLNDMEIDVSKLVLFPKR